MEKHIITGNEDLSIWGRIEEQLLTEDLLPLLSDEEIRASVLLIDALVNSNACKLANGKIIAKIDDELEFAVDLRKTFLLRKRNYSRRIISSTIRPINQYFREYERLVCMSGGGRASIPVLDDLVSFVYLADSGFDSLPNHTERICREIKDILKLGEERLYYVIRRSLDSMTWRKLFQKFETIRRIHVNDHTRVVRFAIPIPIYDLIKSNEYGGILDSFGIFDPDQLDEFLDDNQEVVDRMELDSEIGMYVVTTDEDIERLRSFFQKYWESSLELEAMRELLFPEDHYLEEI